MVRYEEFKWKDSPRDKSAEFNITRLLVHVQSFLRAAEFIPLESGVVS